MYTSGAVRTCQRAKKRRFTTVVSNLEEDQATEERGLDVVSNRVRSSQRSSSSVQSRGRLLLRRLPKALPHLRLTLLSMCLYTHARCVDLLPATCSARALACQPFINIDRLINIDTVSMTGFLTMGFRCRPSACNRTSNNIGESSGFCWVVF